MNGSSKAGRRVRQACEPCRRKKTKCSGEQPNCSLCERLKQPCAYAEDPDAPGQSPGQQLGDASVLGKRRRGDESGPGLHDRLDSLEATLSEVVQALKDSQRREHPARRRLTPSEDAPSNNATTIPRRPRWDHSSAPLPSTVSSAPSDETLTTDVSLKQIAETYRRCCECQPMPLFDCSSDTFVETFSERDDEIICAVIALTSRFLHDAPRVCDADDATQKAFRLAMQRVANGRVEMSTLQTFCILSLLDFDSGRQERALMLCSLAASLASSAKLHLESIGPPHIREERRRCYWSIVLLNKLFGGPGMRSSTVPQFPQNPGNSNIIPHIETPHPGEPFRIMEVVLALSDVWAKTQVYVKTSCGTAADRNRVFPWEPGSSFSATTAAFMGIGTKVPLSHRYRTMDISRMTRELLENDRSFWGPWFMSRLMYHAMACLLNHPLLLIIQIGGAHNVTEAFLHQTSYSVSNHVSWNIHFIQLMKTRDFIPNDPIVVYCAAVVATIELQRSLSTSKGSASLRKKSQDNLEECLGFIKRLRTKWAYASRVAHSLDALAADMSAWAQTDSSDADAGMAVDLTRILDILDFGSAATSSVLEPSSAYRGSLFGPSLMAGRGSFAAAGHGRITRLPRIDPAEKQNLTQEGQIEPPTTLASSFIPVPGGGSTGFSDLGPGFSEGFSLSVSDVFDGPFQDCAFWPVHLEAPDIDVQM